MLTDRRGDRACSGGFLPACLLSGGLVFATGVMAAAEQGAEPVTERPVAELSPAENVGSEGSAGEGENAGEGGAAEETVGIEQKSEQREDLPSLAEVLGATDDAAVDALTENCLQTRRIRSHRVLDQQHIVFVMNDRKRFLVRFPRRCFGLRRGDPIAMAPTTGRLCRLDTIRALRRTGFGFDPGIQCVIPGFQQVTPEQVDYLVEALKRRRT